MIHRFLWLFFLILWVQMSTKVFLFWVLLVPKEWLYFLPNPLWWVYPLQCTNKLVPNFQRNRSIFIFFVILWFQLRTQNQSVRSRSLWLSHWFWESPRRATHSQWHFHSPESLWMWFEFPFLCFRTFYQLIIICIFVNKYTFNQISHC